MSHTSSKTTKPSDVVRTVVEHPFRVALPVVVLTLVALIYALLRTPTWEASQAMIVRDEAGASPTRPGKFGHVDDMKSTQETLLELAKSRGVLTQALVEVGPPRSYKRPEKWPTPKDVDNVQGAVTLSPPKGAEFGKTEVFYLKVQAEESDRAVRLAAAICRSLQARFETLRDAKARSVVHEVTKTVSLAKADLNQATRALGAIEKVIGQDLAELRILNEQPSGDSDLRRTMLELDKELREHRAAQSENRELLKVLVAAQVDPGRLLASPARLLRTQPGLERLKAGLVDAQLRTSQLLGTRTARHPQVIAAKAEEQEISNRLHNELAIGIRGIEVDFRLTAERVSTLQRQRNSVKERLQRLAAVRAEYSNLNSAVRHRTDILKTAEQELADAGASRAAAHTTSLVNLIDHPDAGTRPLGPGRTATVLGGMLGGLLLGCALVFLTVVPSTGNPARNGHASSNGAAIFSSNRGVTSVKQALRKLGPASSN